MNEGYVIVAKKPDGSVFIYGQTSTELFPTRESAEAFTREPLQGERLESEWECTVHALNGLPE